MRMMRTSASVGSERRAVAGAPMIGGGSWRDPLRQALGPRRSPFRRADGPDLRMAPDTGHGSGPVRAGGAGPGRRLLWSRPPRGRCDRRLSGECAGTDRRRPYRHASPECPREWAAHRRGPRREMPPSAAAIPAASIGRAIARPSPGRMPRRARQRRTVTERTGRHPAPLVFRKAWTLDADARTCGGSRGSPHADPVMRVAGPRLDRFNVGTAF